MSNTIKNIRNLLLPASFFIPFTLYFLWFAAGGFVVYFLVYHGFMQGASLPGTSFGDILGLLLRSAAWFAGVILALALLSVIVSVVFFLVQKRKGAISFSINATDKLVVKEGNQLQGIHIKISPLLKPLLGFIKLRLKYDGDQYSKKFALAERGQRKVIPTTFEGDYTWSLPEIKEYHVQKLVVYFEDFFQFFSFTVGLPVTNRFYTPPVNKTANDFIISPRKTEDTETRIEELKKVEGEYINYKNFEDNDDVRRIVWKIYARNKELVVRIPEILDPYASEAYLYASFFSQFGNSHSATVDIYFLNYYKTILWAVYQKLAQQGFDIRYIQDQQTASTPYINEQKAVEYAISTSNWQTGKDLKSYVNMKDASVVVLNSLSDEGQVEQLLSAATGSTWFVLVRLSKSLQRSYLVGLVQWLFIQQEKNDLEKYRTNWQLSLLRPKITGNEKKLETLLSKHEKTIVI
ncbi:MAG TPA: DUF58 domain-containing protein [Chitinophagaceae bacterium]|nr:DUF58 domain-containing protein [Chitinophagaceae bacterium]